MIKRKVEMNADKYHDSTMNNIEGVLNSLYNTSICQKPFLNSVKQSSVGI